MDGAKKVKIVLGEDHSTCEILVDGKSVSDVLGPIQKVDFSVSCNDVPRVVLTLIPAEVEIDGICGVEVIHG